ncbi:DUF192 domain-containing protein [Gemmobacter sp.]|uniref:DUF192 domain-containing protein n=1 Tax=Gemmobacter sp. TaxID=1898957 RepID=UPI0025BDEF28|nr:DUF192 domain-containing protein [Gemmobacter sp.]
MLVPLQAGAETACDPAQLELRGGTGPDRPPLARFHVEIADDSAERAKGLMFREAMASGAGMLFVYDRPQPAAFWMKNTLIPLDMVFADARGVVTHVHANAVPGDESPIPGGDAVQYVLEINGGLAARLGIVPGAELRHPAIAGAAWACPAR